MKRTILVVDDFASIRHFVCEMLERRGYNTLCAANGNEAFHVLLQRPTEVQLVLTDYNMPDGTGLDLLKKIKSHPMVAHVPVIFLTTELSPEKMKAARECGLNAWIRKPYRAEVFFGQLEQTLNAA